MTKYEKLHVAAEGKEKKKIFKVKENFFFSKSVKD